MKLPTSAQIASDAVLEEEQRWNSRRKVLKNVRIRYGGTSQEEQEKMVTLIDASRDGFYFTAGTQECHVGMELRLILPTDQTECVCEVVRTERLRSGRLGVGVRIVSR